MPPRPAAGLSNDVLSRGDVGAGCVVADDTRMAHTVTQTGPDELRPITYTRHSSCARHDPRRQHTSRPYKTPLDNEPVPFDLDERSFDTLKDHLWEADAELPSSFPCQIEGCGRRVMTGERRLRAHLTDFHGTAAGTVVVQCRWSSESGQFCGVRIASRNYRMHVLDFHLRALKGRCRVCQKSMTNSNGMKRHLKHCLRGRTVNYIREHFQIRISRRDASSDAAEQRSCHVYLSPETNVPHGSDQH